MTHLVGHPLTTSPPLEKIAIKKKNPLLEYSVATS